MLENQPDLTGKVFEKPDDHVSVEEVIQTSDEITQPLSKNALKRLKRKEERERTKGEWRAKTREKRKESRRRKAAECHEKGLKYQGIPVPKRIRPKNVIETFGKVVFDLSYEGLMIPRELASLCSQIHRCYSVNRRSAKPFELCLSGFKGQVADKFGTSHREYPNWNLSISEKDLQETLLTEEKENIIYLSADAEEILDEIEDGKTYIIGGIVDRNRHKGASLERAQQSGIKSARLPLEKFISMKTCQVLTVLHVFEILVKFRETGSWKDAIETTVPERKMAEASSKISSANSE